MKKIDYIYAWQLSLISLIPIVMVVFFLNIPTVDVNLPIVMTISTFLFGIIAAFAISERYTRFQEMRKLIADETSALSYVYVAASDINKGYASDVKKAVDDYLVASMQYELNNYQNELEDEFRALERAVDKGKNLKGIGNQTIFAKILDVAAGLCDTRKEIALLGKDRMERVQWMTLSSLAVITLASAILMLNQNVVAKLLAVTFSYTIMLIIFMLRDLNNDRWHRESISITPFTEVWDTLELPHFFMKVDIDTKRVIPLPGKKYRIGYHRAGEKPDIREITY